MADSTEAPTQRRIVLTVEFLTDADDDALETLTGEVWAQVAETTTGHETWAIQAAWKDADA